MEEEGAWQTVKSSNPKSQQRSVNTSDVKANRSKSNHQAAVNTISSKSNQKYDGRKDSESRKPTITSTTASAGVSGGKELKKPSTSSSSQPSANGRKLAQSTKKQGLALFDVLLSSKPSGTKDVVVSKVNATSSKSGTVTNKQDSLSSDPSRYDTDFPQTNSQISVWPAMNSIGRKDLISQSSAVTPSPNSVNIENRPSQPPSDGQKSPQKTLGQNTAPPNIPVPPTSSSSSQLKSNILTRQAPHAVSSISNSAFTLEPKRFVYRKKRIKKPSKLKKRILLERLRQLIIQQVKEQQVQELEDLKSSSTSAEDRTIFIFHFLDDYEDVVNIEEDEKEELIGNIRELLSPCGVIFSISILSSAGEHVAEEGEIEHFVAVTFVKASAAKTAVGVLNGLVIAGQKMVVQLKSTLIADKKLHGDKSVIAEEQQQNAVTATADKKGKNKQASKKEEISSTPSVLIVSNVIHEDEVQDEDEVAEVLNDIYHLASSSTALKQGIASIWIEESTLSTKKSHFNNHVMTQLSPALHPMTLLQVSSLTHVCSIMEALHGKVIAGQMLEAGLVWKSSEESLHWMMKEDVSKLLLVGIVIEDMLDEETAEDPDEVLEVLSNIQDLLQQHASPNVLNLVTKKSICDEKDVIIMFDLKDQTDDFFAIFAEVVTTIDALKQVVIAGVALSVKLLATSSLALSDVLDSQRMSHEELLSLGFVEPLRFDDNLCIGIMHYLTEDDLEDMVGDGAANQEMHEQLMTLKTDLLTLLQQSEAIEVVNSIHSVDFLHPSISSKQDAEGESKDYDIAMLFSDIAIAQQAMIYFDHLLLGGSMLEAMIRQWNPSEDQAKLQERRLPEDTTEVKASVSTAITPYQSIDVNQYASVFKVEYDIDIKALQDQSSAEHSISLPKEKKYHVAKQAPKLRRHGLNDVLFESSIPIANDEINLIIKEFLRMISTFQLRLKEKLPAMKVKQKLRYVTGMKQALTSIKASKAKLLIIAPNTEQSDELDSMLTNMIYEAYRKEIPIIYALNKRLLGKALQMSMKQSVVAIFDPDGAYDLYKKVIKFITINTKPLPPTIDV